MTYTVIIEKNGVPVPVGHISNSGFAYDDAYLHGEDARPISVSLPLQEDAFSPQRTKCFFDGLLPEGFTRRTVAQWMHVSEDDYLSILAGLGKECLGAIQIICEPDDIPAHYQKLTLPQVQALAAEGATQSAKLVTESHLSLTGASGKVGLYYDAANNAWYQPFGTAPSTHIVKQSHVRLSGIVVNELLCLHTAKKCGIDVPDCFILDTGGVADENILFATARYDRIFAAATFQRFLEWFAARQADELQQLRKDFDAFQAGASNSREMRLQIALWEQSWMFDCFTRFAAEVGVVSQKAATSMNGVFGALLKKAWTDTTAEIDRLAPVRPESLAAFTVQALQRKGIPAIRHHGCFYVRLEELTQYLRCITRQPSLDPKAVSAALLDAGLLETDASGKNTKKLGGRRYLAISTTIIT